MLKKNPYISCNMYAFVDRSNSEKYRGEQQDYRSVTVLREAPMIPNLVVLKIGADAVTAKAMYPIADVDEMAMPENRSIVN